MKRTEKDYVLHAQELRREGKFYEAKLAVKDGLTAYPKSLNMLIENASLAMDEKRYEQAITIWDDLIHTYEEQAPVGAYIRESVAYRKLGKIEKSREIIDLIIKNNNMNIDAYLEGAAISIIEENWDVAIDYYKNAKEITSSDDDKFQFDINIISVLVMADRFKEARSNIDSLLSQHPDFSKNFSIKEVLAKLCRKETEKSVGDSWKNYWAYRKDYVYLHVCKQIMKIVGSSATTIVDVGSNRTPILEFLPMVTNRYSVDPHTPYLEEGITSVYEDFLLWDSPTNVQFGTCLQVMEHVPNPTDFAQKLLDVCEVVLISVPYLEAPKVNAGHIHSMINLQTIEKWFGKSPNFYYIAREMSGDERIISLFDNKTDRKYSGFSIESSTAMQFKFRWSLDGSGFSAKERPGSLIGQEDVLK